MKRTLILALAILKVAVVDTSDAKAETRLEQLPKQNSSEQVRSEIAEQRSLNPSPQGLKNFQPKQLLLPATNSLEVTQLSERDPARISEAARLIQERFSIKLIPAQNQ